MARERKACAACLENGRTPDEHGGGCRDYLAQARWNRAMARLLGAEPGDRAVPEPPDYSTPGAVTARARERGTLDAVGHAIYAALDSDGRQYRLLRRAVEASTVLTNSVTRVTPARAPGRAIRPRKARLAA